MTEEFENLFWLTNKSWYEFDPSKDDFFLIDNTADKAKRCFELWQNERSDNESSNENIKAMRKRIRTFSVMRTCR